MKSFITFAIGLAMGAAGGYFMAKSKYEDRLNEEISALMDHAKPKFDAAEKKEPTIDSKDKEVFSNLTEQYKGSKKDEYKDYSSATAKSHAEPAILPDSDGEGINVPDADQPFVIPPEDFGDEDEYDVIELTYYSDGVLAGSDDVAMNKENIEQYVGLSSLTRFGEYEDDSVFVRNNRLKADFQIIRVNQTYEEMLKENPYIIQED